MKIEDVKENESYILKFPDAEPQIVKVITKEEKRVIVITYFGNQIAVNPSVLELDDCEFQHRFEHEKRIQQAIVDAAIDWYVNHIYDEVDPLPYDEIISEAIKNTAMNVG